MITAASGLLSNPKRQIRMFPSTLPPGRARSSLTSQSIVSRIVTIAHCTDVSPQRTCWGATGTLPAALAKSFGVGD